MSTIHLNKFQTQAGQIPSVQPLSWSEGISVNWNRITWVLVDVLVVAVNGVGVLLLFGSRLNSGSWDPNAHVALPTTNLRLYLGSLLLYASLTILAFAGTKLYSPTKTLVQSQFQAAAKPLGLATAVFYGFMWCMDVSGLYWIMVGTLAVFDLVGVVGWRKLQREFALSRAASGQGVRRALIIGSGESGRELANYLRANVLLGYSVVGFLDGDARNPEVLGAIKDLSQIVRSQFIDDVFIAGTLDRNMVAHLRDEAAACRVNVEMVPTISQYAGHWRQIGDLPVKVLRYEPIPRIGLLFKRLLDIVGATIGLLLCLPLFAVVSLLIRLDSPGPCFYRAWRIGKKGVKFRCVKLRTMQANADAIKAELRNRNLRQGPTFKIESDPRVTKMGRILRKYSIDELPQLWNVLKGDMSLVGPRPHPVDDYERYELDHRVRLTVTPGLTGLWQITARNDPSFELNMAIDLKYIRHWSFWVDVKLIFGTIPAVIRGEGK
jgi:exopolysaccharide biosynthesis polyprenyl glycosylphosphotransferase